LFDETKETSSAAEKVSVTSDNPVRPNYYRIGGLEVFDAIEAWGLQDNAYRFTAIRYLIRAGCKDSNKTAEDLRKAIVYIEREIRVIETNEKGMKKIEAEQIVEAEQCGEQSDSMRCEHNTQVQIWLEAFAGERFSDLISWLRHAVLTKNPERWLHLSGPPGTGKSLLRTALAPLGEDVYSSICETNTSVLTEIGDKGGLGAVLHIATQAEAARFLRENYPSRGWLRDDVILKHIYHLCGVR
jgi:hypothetical protein